MRYLSLFSGAGCGDLGCQHLLGWTCAGYVEFEPYCQDILRLRQSEGYLSKAPVFGDIREFGKAILRKEVAEEVKVDVITAGFP